jgi:excinuclease ABC subunit C
MPRTAQDGPGLFELDPFTGFGPSRFRPPDEPGVGGIARGRRPNALLAGIKQSAPKWPGVYSMLNGRGRVIYVGKAKNLRSRLLSYFRTNSRDPKAGRILEATRTLVWEQAADEFGALLRELELIRRFRPRFNVLGQPGPRRYVYLCLGKPPAPYAYLTREPTGKEVACYGPLTIRDRAEDAVRRLNDYFRLRDCPRTVTLSFADQPGLFVDERIAGCLRYDIKTCLAPCATACTRQEYGANVRAARAFLDGRDRSPLKQLKERMTTASVAFRYEAAAAARDRLQLLSWLDDRLTFLRSARRGGSFIYSLTGADGTAVWYLIHRGEVQAAVREPGDADSLAATTALCHAIFDQTAVDLEVTDRIVDSVLLVAAWFRKFPVEKARLRTYQQAQRSSFQ